MDDSLEQVSTLELVLTVPASPPRKWIPDRGSHGAMHPPKKKVTIIATSHDLGPQKVAFWKGNPLISGKSRLVKYYLGRFVYILIFVLYIEGISAIFSAPVISCDARC